jgi:hypothetical protein
MVQCDMAGPALRRLDPPVAHIRLPAWQTAVIFFGQILQFRLRNIPRHHQRDIGRMVELAVEGQHVLT